MEIYISYLQEILSFSSHFRRLEMNIFFVNQPLWQTIFHNL